MDPTTAATRAAAARAAWLHALAVVPIALLTVTVVPLGPWRPVGEAVVYLLGLAAAVVAVRRNHTPLAASWKGVGAAMVLFTVSSALQVPELAGVAVRPLETAHGGLTLAAYAALLLAALAAAKGEGRRRSWDAWADTVSILLGAGLAVAAFVGGAAGFAPGLTAMGIGVPMIVAVLLLVCFPWVASAAARSVSTMAVLAAGVLAVTGYVGRIIAGPRAYMPLLDPLPLLAIAALILAARHPSVARMGERSDRDEGGTGRIVGLGTALLITPVLLLLWGIRHGGTGVALGVGSGVLTGLALWRMTRLTREGERSREALAAGELRLRLLLENAADVICIIDRDGTVGYVSPAVESLLGRPAAAHLGQPALELIDPEDRGRLQEAVAAVGAAPSDGPAAFDVRLRHSDGGTRWVELRISGRVSAAGIDGWVVNAREVTDRRLFEEELRRQATTDPLTGVLNRTAFLDRLTDAVAHASPASPPAVLFVDIDDFKAVNDSYGHAVGDELLVAVGRRLAGCIRSGDVVARLGGDEFALLLPSADRSELPVVADRVLAELRAPLRLSEGTVVPTASVGGALGGPDCSAELLLQRADTAMYSAKRAGKNGRALLDPSDDALVL